MDPVWQEIAAAAAAALGDTATAVEHAELALALAQNAGRPDVAVIEARLNLYRAGKPFVGAEPGELRFEMPAQSLDAKAGS